MPFTRLTSYSFSVDYNISDDRSLCNMYNMYQCQILCLFNFST